ncbi:hypothetical protein NDU88_005442 [Pleurodeles waltl]|uniref:Retroviral integrase C-terminal SH3 domain-containing protein n=1 Tax=Pleurodeles waltl TaxID=8319 RepID=A0AAV7UIT2_PLEWA|nr:hypothetical protein NDU88_005442 [Pleurodeles waltl]
MEAVETPFDINERVLQELQQFCDNDTSTSAASTGIKDVPVTPTGWIPKVGDLVREKVAVKKEYGPSYRAPAPVLGIHGTITVILPPLVGAKENLFVSIDNVKVTPCGRSCTADQEEQPVVPESLSLLVKKSLYKLQSATLTPLRA